MSLSVVNLSEGFQNLATQGNEDYEAKIGSFLIPPQSRKHMSTKLEPLFSESVGYKNLSCKSIEINLHHHELKNRKILQS